MGYVYDPEKFWSSVEAIKGIKNELLKLSPEMRGRLREYIYRAMEATRKASMSTIDDEDFPRNSFEHDMETDRKALAEVISSFKNQ
jgi:hypothetical protein